MAWRSCSIASNPRSNMLIPWPPQLAAWKRITLLLSKGTPTVHHLSYWSKINLLQKFKPIFRRTLLSFYIFVYHCVLRTFISDIMRCVEFIHNKYQTSLSILYGAACHQGYVLWPNGCEKQVSCTAFIFWMFLLKEVEGSCPWRGIAVIFVFMCHLHMHFGLNCILHVE